MTAEAPADSFDFAVIFHSHYRRIARVIPFAGRRGSARGWAVAGRTRWLPTARTL